MKKWQKKLESMPLDPIACKTENAKFDSVEVKIEDIKIFTQLMSQIYPQFVGFYSEGLNDLAKSKAMLLPQERVLKDFFNFNGIQPYSCGKDLERKLNEYTSSVSLHGNYPEYSYKSIADSIENCDFINKDEKK